MLGTIRVAISLAHLTKSRIPLIRFALLNKSVERRRRIRRLDIDSSEDPLPLFMEMSRQPMLAKPGARKRGLYKDSPATRNSKTLSWILRHGAKTEGITMRPDGYVPVSELLQNHRLSDLTFPLLQEIVQNDTKNRYSLNYESGVWFIRANQGHSIKTVQMDLQPITTAGQIPMAVHGTTREAWRSISTQGLSKMTRNHIHLAQGIAGQSIVSGMRASSQILIYIDIQSAIDAGLKFFLSTNGVVLSEGDENGLIAPKYFSRVENANRTALPGWEGIAEEMYKVLAEELPPLDVEDQVAEEVTCSHASDVVSTVQLREDETPELVDKLRNVELQ